MKMILASAAFAAGLLIAGQSGAQISADPSQVQGGAFQVEPNHTRVQFNVLHMGFTHYWGDFTGASGTLDLDPVHLAQSKVSVSIPVASVSTTNAKLDGEIKSPMFLDGAAYPTITFTSTGVTPTSATTADITGQLTLHGVTRPITLHATFNAGGANPMSKTYTVGFDAKGSFNRSDFGVKTYVPLIGDNVDVTISAAFEKKG
ncbi:MAG: YceI family protein [Caulobacteraceae bacterium]|nr:YceI family protein [Caulobacteraceae bacterium]